MKKNEIRKRALPVLVLVLILLLAAVLPCCLYSMYKTDSQDGFIVLSDIENINAYTGGELSIERSASCSVRKESESLNSLRLPVPVGSVAQINAISENIEKLTIVSSMTSEYILVEFENTYQPGERFDFSISYVLYGAYVTDVATNSCVYEYIAGDFAGAYVDSAEIYWVEYAVTGSNSGSSENGKLVWRLCPGREPIVAQVSYSLTTFNGNVNLTALYEYAESSAVPYYITIAGAVAVAVGLAVVMIITRIRRKKQYMSGRGFLFWQK